MLATAYAAEAPAGSDGPAHAIHQAPARIDTLSQRILAGGQRTYDAKQHIFLEGDAVTDVYRVEAGHVSIYKTMPDGRRQVIDFAYPGDIVGLGAIGVHATSAQAMSRTCVRALPVAALHGIARDDARLGLRLYEAVSRELMGAREMLLTVSQRTATERLAAFLIALSRRAERNGEDPNELVLPMTRADIADFLGLTIETVSRMFSRFRAAGLIGLDQSILVTVLDPEGLAALAEGSGGT